MTPRQFDLALSGTRMRERPDSATVQAARLVLVDGLSRNAAAKAQGIDIKAVSRAVERLRPRERCPHCHQLMPG